MQIGQIADGLSGRYQGVLPSQPEINSRNQEQAKAITLRNGRSIKTTVDMDEEKKEQQEVVNNSADNSPMSSVPTTRKVDDKNTESDISSSLSRAKPYLNHWSPSHLENPRYMPTPSKIW